MTIMFWYFIACIPICLLVVAHHDYTQWRAKRDARSIPIVDDPKLQELVDEGFKNPDFVDGWYSTDEQWKGPIPPSLDSYKAEDDADDDE